MALKYPHDIDSYMEGKQPVILDIYKKCGLERDWECELERYRKYEIERELQI